jgi:hypothetical protein
VLLEGDAAVGRAEEPLGVLDREQLVRLCQSIARVCGLTVIDPITTQQQPPLSDAVGLPQGLKLKKTHFTFKL